MPIDTILSALSPEARLEAIEVGTQFNKDEVLGQIALTRAAFSTTGAALLRHGFADVDAAELGEIEAALFAATEDRADASLDGRAGRIAFRATVSRAKAAAKGTTALLRNLASAVARRPDPNNPDASPRLAAVLAAVGPVGRSATRIASQVDLLLSALGEPSIEKAGESRGVPEARAQLEKARQSLQEGQWVRAANAGTPSQTQAQNLLEGLAVQYLREARKAARAAAERLGDPALAKAYELTALYSDRGGAAPTRPTPVVEPQPAPAPEPKA